NGSGSGVPYIVTGGWYSTIQGKWIIYGYGQSSGTAIWTCADLVPNANSVWTAVGTTFGINEVEPSIAECSDGTLFCVSRVNSFTAYLQYEYSTNGGVSWTSPAGAGQLQNFDGAYSAGAQIRPYIASDNAPAICFQAYGYLWILA